MNEDFFYKLTNLEIFEDFKEDNETNRNIIKMVYDNFKVKTFKKGDIIIKENDIGDNFYILLEGKVQISRKSPLGDSISLADFDDSMNVFFGEAALLENEIRSATVKATSDCKTLTLSSHNFLKICEKESFFGYKVLLCISKRLKSSINKLNNDITTLYSALFKEIEG